MKTDVELVENQYKGEGEVTAKYRIEGYLNSNGVSILEELRMNEEVDEYCHDNDVKILRDSAEIKTWLNLVSEKQAEKLIEYFTKYAA